MLRVYLDQMHWINLSRARVGSPGGERYTEVLGVIERAARQGDVELPLGVAHYIENHKRRDWRSRREVGEVMFDLSGGVRIAPQDVLIRAEIPAAVSAFADFPPPPAPVPFGSGMGFALGRASTDYRVPDHFARLMTTAQRAAWERYGTAELELGALTGLDSDREAQIRASDLRFQPEVFYASLADQAVKRQRDRDGRVAAGWHKGEKAERLFHAVALAEWIDTYAAALRASWIHPRQFLQTQGAEGMSALLAAVPTLHATAEFWRQRNVGSQATITPNDLGDLAGLPAAIVYCDIVVTERQHAKNLQGLAALHGTVLLHDLADLTAHPEIGAAHAASG